jgi:uncharacterized membrane protein
MTYDRKTVKRTAKANMKGRALAPWKMIVIVSVLQSVLWLITLIPLMYAGARYVTKHVVEVLPLVVAGVLQIAAILANIMISCGVDNYCLRLYRGVAVYTADLLAGFTKWRRTLASGALVVFYAVAGELMLMVIFCLLYYMTAILPPSMSLVSTLAVPAVYGVCVTVWLVYITLKCAMVPFIAMERSDLGAFDTLRESDRIMRGRCGKLLTLELSFAGWDFFVLAVLILIPSAAGLLGLVIKHIDLGSVVLGRISANLTAVMPYILNGLIVAWAVTLVIGSWVRCYVGTARAGFYCSAMGEDVEIKDIRMDPDELEPAA